MNALYALLEETLLEKQENCYSLAYLTYSS